MCIVPKIIQTTCVRGYINVYNFLYISLVHEKTERDKMLKVLKFGGSSLADSSQFAKVKAIVESDSSREVVIVSAPGKRCR